MALAKDSLFGIISVSFVTMVLLFQSCREKPIGWSIKQKLFRDISAGIGFIHAAGVVHGDLKPSNILIDSNYNAKIADFGGIHRILTLGSRNNASLKFDKRIVITLRYVPPEATNSGLVGPPMDMYATGKIMWELVCNGVEVSFDESALFRHFIPYPLVEIIKAACHPEWKKRSNALQLMDSLILFSMDSFIYDGRPLLRDDVNNLTRKLNGAFLDDNLHQNADHDFTADELEASDYMSSILEDSILSPAFITGPRMGSHPVQNSLLYDPAEDDCSFVVGSPLYRSPTLSHYNFGTFQSSTLSGSGLGSVGSTRYSTRNREHGVKPQISQSSDSNASSRSQKDNGMSHAI
jgi:serine/threonine protein kinase